MKTFIIDIQYRYFDIWYLYFSFPEFSTQNLSFEITYQIIAYTGIL